MLAHKCSKGVIADIYKIRFSLVTIVTLFTILLIVLLIVECP
jgi:uncharacterized protein HemY